MTSEETGTTFAENARIKAREACRLTGLAAIADDSGLCVDALGGAPGVYSARSGERGGRPGQQSEAVAGAGGCAGKTSVPGAMFAPSAAMFPDQTELTAAGTCEGRIGYELSGDHGFGYDPLFYVGNRSFGQYKDEEKDAISHRGKALRLFCEKLKEYQVKNA